MKKLFLMTIVLLAATVSFSQPKVIINETDDFSGARLILTNNQNMGGGLKMQAGSQDGVMVLFVYPGFGCCGATGNQVLLLTDTKEVIELQDISSVDCKDNCSQTTIISPDIVEENVVKVRVRASKGQRDFEINPELFRSLIRAVLDAQ